MSLMKEGREERLCSLRCQGLAGTDGSRSRSAAGGNEGLGACQRTSAQINLCVLRRSHCRLVQGRFLFFCEAKPSPQPHYHPVRHRLTVAGKTDERLFFCLNYFCHFVFFYFSNKLLHDVCLKTNCVLFWSMIRRRKKTIIQSNCITFWGTERVC